MTATQVARTLKVTPLSWWFSPHKWRFASGSSPGHLPGDGCLLQIMALVGQTTLPTPLPCSNLSAWPNLRQPAPVSFSWKETGASNTAAALIALGFAATPLITIGVTNADVTSNSAADDGAADQGMDCT